MKRTILSMVVILLFAWTAKADHFEERTYEITKVTENITVDGVMDEGFWADVPWADLVPALGDDDEAWDPADLSARFKMAWHEENGFYIFVEVTDDVLIDRNDVIDANPDEEVHAWHADLVEVHIRPHGPRPGYDVDDPDLCRYDDHTFQFRFNYYNFFGGGRPGLSWGAGVDFWSGANVYFEFEDTADGYNIEIHIPFTHFEAQEGFVLSEAIALEIQVADVDALLLGDQDGKVVVFNNTIYPGSNWNEPCWWGKGILADFSDDDDTEPSPWQENVYEIPHTTGLITVDGVMDEAFWADAQWYDLYKRDDGDGTDWSDEDLSARFKMLWHEDEGFYVFISVKDDMVIDINDVIDANPDVEDVEPWHADLIEFMIRAHGPRPGYDPDDPDLCRYDEHTFMFRFNYYNHFGGGRPGLSWGAGVDFWAGENVYFAFEDTADGYDCEIHIPFTHFEAQEGFQLAQQIALDFVVADVDDLIIADQDGKALVFNNIYNFNNWNEPCYWGKGILLDPVSTADLTSSNQTVKVYPNPAASNLTVVNSSEFNQFQVMDVTGRVLQTQELSASETINLNISHLNQGIYFLRFVSEAGAVQTVKFIKK